MTIKLRRCSPRSGRGTDTPDTSNPSPIRAAAGHLRLGYFSYSLSFTFAIWIWVRRALRPRSAHTVRRRTGDAKLECAKRKAYGTVP